MSLVRIRPGGERCQQPGRVLSRRATMQSAISPSFSLRRQRLGPSAGNYDDAWAERLAPVQAIAGEPGHSRKVRSEEHTSELQSLMRISYAVFCLKKKKKTYEIENIIHYKNKSNYTVLT